MVELRCYYRRGCVCTNCHRQGCFPGPEFCTYFGNEAGNCPDFRSASFAASSDVNRDWPEEPSISNKAKQWAPSEMTR